MQEGNTRRDSNMTAGGTEEEAAVVPRDCTVSGRHGLKLSQPLSWLQGPMPANLQPFDDVSFYICGFGTIF